ncbi:MAG: lipopolysaccharide assembly protein LapA domain-containing protein [Actinomycetota bacterium]
MQAIPQEPQPPQERRFTKADAKLLAFGVLALLAGIFVGQNTGQVKVHFVFFSANIRLIWVFLLCILIGVLLDRLLTWRGVLPSTKHRRDRRAAKHQNRDHG